MNFYNDLNNLLNQRNNKSSIVLVAGDFNGETDIDKCLGNFSDRRRNQNRQHLINLCSNHNINNKHMFQTQREKINNTGTN